MGALNLIQMSCSWSLINIKRRSASHQLSQLNHVSQWPQRWEHLIQYHQKVCHLRTFLYIVLLMKKSTIWNTVGTEKKDFFPRCQDAAKSSTLPENKPPRLQVWKFVLLWLVVFCSRVFMCSSKMFKIWSFFVLIIKYLNL